MSEEKISVIIPIYNVENYLEKCIDSVLKQTYKNFELILINDGSKDNSLNICKKYETEDNRVILIDKKNAGVWQARYDGILKSTGKYISFIDSDDYIEKDYIERLYLKSKEDDYDIVVCGFKRIEDKTNKIYSSEMNKFGDLVISKNNNFEELISVNTSLWNKLYKRELLNKLPNMITKPKVLEDMMFLTLLYPYTNKVAFVNDLLYNYIVREKSAISTIKRVDIEITQRAILEIKDYYIKNNVSKEMVGVFSSMVFLHFGISLMFRISYDKNINLNEELKKMKQFLNSNFKNWNKIKYLKLFYIISKKSKNLKLGIMKKVYDFNMFRLFLVVYKFMIDKIKIDIKW
jgi:glycosyltransferase involved in cell wall biosynthesis